MNNDIINIEENNEKNVTSTTYKTKQCEYNYPTLT